MSYGSQTRNPYEHDETPDDNPVYCRGCKGYLGQRDELTPQTAKYWNGWWWCPEEADEMERLAKLPDPVNEVRR